MNGVDADVDAIVSGHTHLAYNHRPGHGCAAGRAPGSRGQYGTNLNQLVFSVDNTAHTATVDLADDRAPSAPPPR